MGKIGFPQSFGPFMDWSRPDQDVLIRNSPHKVPQTNQFVNKKIQLRSTNSTNHLKGEKNARSEPDSNIKYHPNCTHLNSFLLKIKR